jgi:NADP-dependent aldehyde dehydrogenase
MSEYKDASIVEINEVMSAANSAASVMKKLSLVKRAELMNAIADGLENSGDDLIQLVMSETNLPDARLRGERGRTIFQLRSYAKACAKGDWLEASIDTAIPDKVPPKPDIRKMLVPLGPVVVFGSSNFPFAYSTAGGDTASALAAGCPVIVKAHPAHPKSSEAVADIIHQAVKKCGLPTGVFTHVHGASFEVGKALVLHPFTKAVGFTGSYTGGKALFDMANQREEPIPVFAEMGSVNPVFLLPEKITSDPEGIAASYAGSITLGVGQFCTNPGLIIGIKGDALNQFIVALSNQIGNIPPAAMLHEGITKAFFEKRKLALSQQGVELIAISSTEAKENQGIPTIATTTGDVFLKNKLLHQEVFGPYSLIVQCSDKNELLQVAKKLEGQLTATIMATDADINQNTELLDVISDKCGRMILNGVPTGVEVCLSMHHGGPFPSTTDSRFTSVGADAIKRFARPISFQNFSDHLLPMELQNENMLKINRRLNDIITNQSIS